MDDKRELKVAIAGTGYFSQFHFDAWSRCPEVEIVGVAGLDKAKARQVAAPFHATVFESAIEMMDECRPDLIDIVTPPPTHVQLIEAAAARNIDVVCQKPFCGNLDTAKRAADMADQFGIKLVVHENFRFQPWYQAIAKEIKKGLVGRVYKATFRLRPGDGQGPQAYMERQPYFQNMERFLIHETAIHYIDVFRSLFGEVQSVYADIVRFNPVIAGEDSCNIILALGNDVRGHIDGNRLSDHLAENPRRTMGEMLVEGEKGVLTLDGAGKIEFRAHGRTKLQIIHYDWKDRGFGGDCVYNFTRHVVDALCNGDALQNKARDYITNLMIEEACYASAESGRRLEF